jgi:hypothetical protein
MILLKLYEPTITLKKFYMEKSKTIDLNCINNKFF